MARKNLYPTEPETKRDHRRPAAAARQSGAAPKSDRERSEAPTEPPPGRDKPQGAASQPRTQPSLQRTQPSLRRPSDARSADPPTRRGLRRPTPSAAVDEVVADMSNDPRRERDDDA